MENQVTMTPPKETNKASITDHIETEMYMPSKNPAIKESRIIILKKLSELQEHTERKLNQ